ncbi:MAG: hypothetical protein Q9227_007463 [Pyrenula ochraceoflavens]
MFATGSTFYVSIIQIPQRFQVVNSVSAERAGILMLPFTLMTPTFGSIAGWLGGKFPNHSAYIVAAGSVFTLVGIALLGTLPTGKAIPNEQYGYQVLLGIGQGLALPPIVLILRLEVIKGDLAAALGSNNLLRTLGGCLGLAISGAIERSRLSSSLSKFLDPSQVAQITKSGVTAAQASSPLLASLPADQVAEITRAYGKGYNDAFLVMIAFSALGTSY